jgi:hypothetical protein
MTPSRAPWLLLPIAVAAAGCGYGFAAGQGRLPAGAEQVFVRPLENRTTDAEAGALVAAALRRELARRSADGGPGASARIEGEILDSTFGPSSVSGTYRATLRVAARLMVDGKVVAERTVTHGEDLLAGQDPLESEGRRRLALRSAAEAVAQEIVEGFER